MKKQKENLAETAFQAEDFNTALKLYLELIEFEPQNAHFHQKIAECYYALAGYEEAEASSRKAIDLNSQLALPHTLLAYIYYKDGKFEDSLSEAIKAYALQPDSDKVLTCYGTILLANKRNEEAISLLLQALSINPKNVFARNNLGIAYRWAGNLKQYSIQANIVFKQRPSLSNFSKMLSAYQQRYAVGLAIVTVFVFPVVYVFHLTLFLIIPIYVVLKGWWTSYQFLQNHQFRNFFIYFTSYSLLATLIYMTIIISR